MLSQAMKIPRNPSEYSRKLLIVVSSTEEFIFGALPLLVVKPAYTLSALWIVRSIWAVAHLPNEQVRRQFRYHKRDFAANMVFLSLMVPELVYLWYYGLWPIAFIAHSGWNLFGQWAIHNRLKRDGFKDFWENIGKIVGEET